jgi:hypothetical protein
MSKTPIRQRASARVPSHRSLGSTAARFTPGPWTLGKNGDDCAPGHAICAGPYVIAKVYGGGYPTADGGTSWAPRTQADAKLIVCAPELLAAVKELRLVCALQQRLIATNTRLTERLLERLSAHNIRDGFGKRAEHAIAKAEGR